MLRVNVADHVLVVAVAGASPYSLGPPSQGTPTPMMSPAPGQDSMGYSMGMNGDYSSPMSGSQVGGPGYWPAPTPSP